MPKHCSPTRTSRVQTLVSNWTRSFHVRQLCYSACKSPSKQIENVSVKKTRGERQQLSKNVLLAFAMNFTKNETAMPSENARFTTINSAQSNFSSMLWTTSVRAETSEDLLQMSADLHYLKVTLSRCAVENLLKPNVILGIEEVSGCDIDHRIEQELFHWSFAAGARSILVTDNWFSLSLTRWHSLSYFRSYLAIFVIDMIHSVTIDQQSLDVLIGRPFHAGNWLRRRLSEGGKYAAFSPVDASSK